MTQQLGRLPPQQRRTAESITDDQAVRTPERYEPVRTNLTEPWPFRAERDSGGNGKDGPINISRVRVEQWPGFTRPAVGAFSATGYGNIGDQNAVCGHGWFPQVVNEQPRSTR